MARRASRKKPARGTTARTRKPVDAGPEVTNKRVFTAKTADRHELYQLALQSPELGVHFLALAFEKVRRSKATHLREDFCGTALYAAYWLRRGKEYTAEGFDICPDTLAWGKACNFDPLGSDAKRAQLHLKDVREKSHKPPQVRTAQNFSYQVFKHREEMLAYLRSVREDLAPDGVFIMDIYGGPDSMMELTEVRQIDAGFTYVWEQASYKPGTADYRTHIHFRFADGSEMKRAFTYDWRLWTLPEMVDLLHEVGFEHVDQYWETTAKDGVSGNRVFKKSRQGKNWRAWITYLVAYRAFP